MFEALHPEADRPHRPMREKLREAESSGIRLDDLMHIVFCHKWKITLTALAGMVLAGIAWFAWPPQFVSEAKILIRYVVESRPVTGMGDKDANTQLKSPDSGGVSIINSEVEIITSRDLAEQVADEVGPKRILLDRKVMGDPKIAAGGVIARNLRVEVPLKGKVIRLTFTHGDPVVAQMVLTSLTTNYLVKHGQIHRSIGINDISLQRTNYNLNGELQRLAGRMHELKTNMSIVSFEEARRANAAQVSKITDEKLSAEAELASLLAVAASESKTNPLPVLVSNQTASATSTNLAENTNALPLGSDMKSPEYANKVTKYREVCAKLSGLEIREMEMIPLFTDEYLPLRNVRAQITEIKKQKDALEKQNPGLLLAPALPVSGQVANSINPTYASFIDSNKIISLQAKMMVLTNQLLRLSTFATALDEAETEYLDLQRKKESAETNLRMYSAVQAQSMMNQYLEPGSVSNIGIVQSATPPAIAADSKLKVCGGLLAAGLFGGLLWALLVELLFSPAIKRPSEVQAKLRMPLFLWIPEISRNGKTKAKSPAQVSNLPDSPLSAPNPPLPAPSTSDNELMADNDLASDPAMRHYYEALRDRLIHYFEIKNMTHKPKLVAITSCSRGAGVSTIAAGVAALFSETGDGNVLLVDMNLNQAGGGVAHPFHRGKPGCSLTEALQLEKRENAMVQENLYMASVGETDGKLSALMPKKFGTLVPRMKASDYDYIIFDMPPVSQTSITTRLAAKMDINLLIIAAEEDATPKVQEAVAFLKESGANVGGVLNRRQFHVPKRLRHEL